MRKILNLNPRARARTNLQRLDRLWEWTKQKRLGEDDLRRAFIIEFAGMPKAGKSVIYKNNGTAFSRPAATGIDFWARVCWAT
jgi:hypothetical protein